MIRSILPLGGLSSLQQAVEFDRHGWNPLMCAARDGTAESLEKLLEGLSDVVVARLLDAPIDPGVHRVELGVRTLLGIAARHGNHVVVGQLIARGASIDLTHHWDGKTPLLAAAEAMKHVPVGSGRRGHTLSIMLLLNAGADAERARLDARPSDWRIIVELADILSCGAAALLSGQAEQPSLCADRRPGG